MARLSSVGNIILTAVSDGSIIQFGNNKIIRPRIKVLAVQREVPYFMGDEGTFSTPFFSRPIPLPQQAEPVLMTADHLGSVIKVNNIRILGVAAASVMQVGTNSCIDSETRLKHYRHFIRPKPGPQGQTTFVKTKETDDV